VRYRGDEGRVKQILVNLLSNAVKFTEPGGRITVSCGVTEHPDPAAALDGDGPWMFICVEDTGIGISAERLAAVWDPFVQGDMGHTRTHGGTGLGLTISRRLARLLGGNVSARSEAGAGSAFFLWLPAASAPSPTAAPAAAPDFMAVTARG
jgi:signal transduction histidine kinase